MDRCRVRTLFASSSYKPEYTKHTAASTGNGDASSVYVLIYLQVSKQNHSNTYIGFTVRIHFLSVTCRYHITLKIKTQAIAE